MSIVPVLRYADADAAIRFLTGAFGFTENQADRDDDGRVTHAELCYGDATWPSWGELACPPSPDEAGLPW